MASSATITSKITRTTSVEHHIKLPKTPKLPTHDPILRMLEQRAANPPKRKRVVVRIHVPKDTLRSGVTSTITSTQSCSRADTEEVEWQEWKASQARWMDVRRQKANASMKRWKKTSASKKLPTWVKQRPSL